MLLGRVRDHTALLTRIDLPLPLAGQVSPPAAAPGPSSCVSAGIVLQSGMKGNWETTHGTLYSTSILFILEYTRTLIAHTYA